jgi:hypothetical protein
MELNLELKPADGIERFVHFYQLVIVLKEWVAITQFSVKELLYITLK